MRQAGKTLADVCYYIPKNKADYDAIQARKAKEKQQKQEQHKKPM